MKPTKTEIKLDEAGHPVLVLAAPGQKDTRPKPGIGVPRTVNSGNPYTDPRTGKFASGGRRKVPSNAVSRMINTMRVRSGAGSESEFADELERRGDAVRDAAREFENFEIGDAREFLNGRTARQLTDDELEAFLADVDDQRMDDIVDILDQRLRTGVFASNKGRARRFVRVQAPKGFVRRTLNGFDDSQIKRIAARLSARGWEPQELDKHLVGRFSEKRRGPLKSLLGI